MWLATRRPDDGFDGGHYVKTDLYGPGHGQGGVRAYGSSALGGLIRKCELAGGIGHALAFAIPGSRQRNGWEWPATTNDRFSSGYTGNLPIGQLIAIPPTVDLSRLGLSPEGLAIAKAWQDNGACLVDIASALAFHVEPAAVTELGGALDDIGQIRQLLVCVTNNGPTTVAEVLAVTYSLGAAACCTMRPDG